MFERFTAPAVQAVTLAVEETKALGHAAIRPEHIFLGLLSLSDGVAVQVLTDLGITKDLARAEIVRVHGSDAGAAKIEAQVPFTAAGKKVLEIGRREALALGNNFVGTEHLLLAIIRQSDPAAISILRRFDLAPERVREAVIGQLSEADAGLQMAVETASEPDPADPGPPIPVRLAEMLLGDLGNPRVDARLLSAMMVRNGGVAKWLRARGIEADDIARAFPGSSWT